MKTVFASAIVAVAAAETESVVDMFHTILDDVGPRMTNTGHVDPHITDNGLNHAHGEFGEWI